jgi:hypothetical protein
MDDLKSGNAFPGVVLDDTQVFRDAVTHGLQVHTFDVALSDLSFRAFEVALDRERVASQYAYGFPNSLSDCNCTTFLERIGLPLLTGGLNEFISMVTLFP